MKPLQLLSMLLILFLLVACDDDKPRVPKTIFLDAKNPIEFCGYKIQNKSGHDFSWRKTEDDNQYMDTTISIRGKSIPYYFHVSLDCGDRGSISEKYNPERMGWKPRKIMNYGLVKHAAEISISHHSSLYTSWKPYFKPDASPFFIQCDSDPAESWTRCVVYFEAAPRLHVMYHFTYGFLTHWQQIDEIARQAITVKNTQQSL